MEPLRENYGDAISVNYFDVNDDNLDPELKRVFETHNYPFPITFINGEPISAGYISYYDISSRVSEVLKALEQ